MDAGKSRLAGGTLRLAPGTQPSSRRNVRTWAIHTRFAFRVIRIRKQNRHMAERPRPRGGTALQYCAADRCSSRRQCYLAYAALRRRSGRSRDASASRYYGTIRVSNLLARIVPLRRQRIQRKGALDAKALQSAAAAPHEHRLGSAEQLWCSVDACVPG